ncbi:MAG: hypothetical protein JWN21_1780 [Sphingomonas bacterium]|uniref:hypothetical protein n=1 Tax=Sphingomonas bacterium TaxID=1895847 RepID=UPI00261EAE3D|nr:hypothetical protein [Sphingomonas bacterium]MDB5696237.1 hypothetical protein [Sphingomonas bacterium]
MRRALPPLWLAFPGRYASLAPSTARLALAALALLILLSWTALFSADPTAANPAPGEGGDLQLYAGIVEALRHGGSYYATTAEALRTNDYPLRPFVTFRLPTLAVVMASLPERLIAVLLYLLAAGTTLAWFTRFTGAMRRPVAIWFATILLAGGCVAAWQSDLAPFHEIWAGLLIALSLARYRSDRWLETVGWGLAAALIRETAALYLLVMLALAWRDGARREALGWVAALAALALVIAAHAWAVLQVVGPLDPASPGWAGLLGPGFVVRTWHASTALVLVPLAVAGPLIALALAGWTAWRDPIATRSAVTLAAYALLLGLAGRLDTFYWGLLTAPILLIGLAFVPDGLRDLFAAALDTRRIVVRRVGS